MNPAPKAPLRLSVEEDDRLLKIMLHNDTDAPFFGTARCRIEGTDGACRGETAERVSVPPQSETQLLFFDRREIREKKEILRLFLIDEAGNECYNTCWWSKKLRARRFGGRRLETEVFLRAGTVCVSVRAAVFAPDVTLVCDGCTFSENGFTLFAGEEKTVEVQSAKADFAGKVTARCALDRR